MLLVAFVAATISYCHMLDLAREHGEGWRSFLIPLSVDGMLVASTLAIVTKRQGYQRASWVPWLGLILGISATVAANVAAARPDLIARLIAAWPPIALTIAIETLVITLREPREVVAPSAPISSKPAPAAPQVQPKRIRMPSTPDKTSAARALVRVQPGIGRRALAREAGVSEHVARTLLAELAPRNGAKVTADA